MSIAARLHLRQTQSLVMTPQLQQAIKLLQLSNLDLVAYVEQELERNPLLERAEDDREDGAEDPGGADKDGGEAGDSEDGITDAADVAAADHVTREGEESLDSESEDLWAEAGPLDPPESTAFENWGPGGGTFESPVGDLENRAAGGITLREHLLGQINVDLTDPVDRLIARDLVDMIDESGYLVDDPAAVAARLGCEPARVEAVVARLQRLDPPGVFARDLAECLRIQLRERDRLDPAMAALLDNLELLGRRDVAALARICGVDREDLADMVAEIRSLDPKPGLAFDAAEAQPVVPDVIMRSRNGGGWTVELNNEVLPRVLVNQRYYARVSRAARDPEELAYLSRQLQSANWLVRSLHQRATTILKVASEIVRQQHDFFLHGVQHLKPLVLRDIAAEVEMHESTVSRVTSNKYIATPRGVFELKYFFTSAIQASGGGDAHSAEAVKDRIRTLIEAESADDVLSDDRIVTILRKEGIDIARRTVAKYREAMGIPSSIRRRRERAAGL